MMFQLIIDLPEELHAKVRKAANSLGMSENEWIVQLIEKELNNTDTPREDKD